MSNFRSEPRKTLNKETEISEGINEIVLAWVHDRFSKRILREISRKDKKV